MSPVLSSIEKKPCLIVAGSGMSHYLGNQGPTCVTLLWIKWLMQWNDINWTISLKNANSEYWCYSLKLSREGEVFSWKENIKAYINSCLIEYFPHDNKPRFSIHSTGKCNQSQLPPGCTVWCCYKAAAWHSFSGVRKLIGCISPLPIEIEIWMNWRLLAVQCHKHSWVSSDSDSQLLTFTCCCAIISPLPLPLPLLLSPPGDMLVAESART